MAQAPQSSQATDKPPTWLASVWVRGLLALAGVAAVAVITSIWLFARSVNAPLSGLSEPQIYEVRPGSNLSRVAADLHARGQLVHPLVLRLLARWQGVGATIQQGEYRLQPGMSAADLLQAMVSGEVVQYRVTLLEGWTLRQALAAIQQAEKVNLQLKADVSLADIARAMAIPRDNPEGLVFPDTYFYTKGTSDVEILRRGYQRLETVLQDAWSKRLGALPYETPYQALIMASIIEKESAAASERGHIAGVFVRRLEQGMRLQSDPTVIYGIGEDFDGDLRRTDLRTTTDYNTYRINGLPPTPIALAGRDSIHASLNPLPSDYLYFVSRGDGSHQFSATLEQHNAAVNRYQRQNTDQNNNQASDQQNSQSINGPQ
jgi:UPF0755 protein